MKFPAFNIIAAAIVEGPQATLAQFAEDLQDEFRVPAARAVTTSI